MSASRRVCSWESPRKDRSPRRSVIPLRMRNKHQRPKRASTEAPIEPPTASSAGTRWYSPTAPKLFYDADKHALDNLPRTAMARARAGSPASPYSPSARWLIGAGQGCVILKGARIASGCHGAAREAQANCTRETVCTSTSVGVHEKCCSVRSACAAAMQQGPARLVAISTTVPSSGMALGGP